MDASLRCASFSMTSRGSVDASLRNTPFRMTKLKVSFQALFRVIPSNSEESTYGCFAALRFIQHDKAMSFRARARNPLMDASLRSA